MRRVALSFVLLACACGPAPVSAPARCQLELVKRDVYLNREAYVQHLAQNMRKDSTLTQVQLRREQVRTLIARFDSLGDARIESARIIDSIAGCFAATYHD